LEENYRRGILLKKSLAGLFASLFTSPITFILFALIVVMFTAQTNTYKNWKAKRNSKKAK
jgi:putative tricarboxylic transport membrane protein